MKPSTGYLLWAFLIGLPFLWLEHPRAALGIVGFYALAISMCATALWGAILWAKESKNDDRDN